MKSMDESANVDGGKVLKEFASEEEKVNLLEKCLTDSDVNSLVIDANNVFDELIGSNTMDYVFPDSTSPATFVQGPDPTSQAGSSVQGSLTHSTHRQHDYVLPDPTSSAASSIQGRSAHGLGPTSSETIEVKETLKELEASLQLRLPEHSITGLDPVLVISCGGSQDSEETYFTSYIFNELRILGFTPLRYDLTRSTDPGNAEMLYSSRVGIMVISMNYGCSRECLDGFVVIMDQLKENNLELIPVYFKVSVLDVRDQSGSLGRAISQLGNSLETSQVQKWREAINDSNHS